jgi:tRNA (mo5U34)-methyltransferase
VDHKFDIRELSSMALDFERRLGNLKRSNPLRDYDWYPYRTLSCFCLLDELLTGDHRQLLSLHGDSPILDIGCGDGDLSFFLNSLGLSVDAVDHPATNCNHMEGVYALKHVLKSTVDVQAIDLDNQFGLPRQHYGFTFFLGVLYHLRNPIYVLERLAERSQYCVLSTRIAASSPGRQGNLQDIPVAYLLDEDEVNDDCTNYWVFSEPGLRRLLRRTGWDICDYLTKGDPKRSDPVSDAADQRAFCLLRSVWVHPTDLTLGHGWHGLEFGAYRWTERVFAVDLFRPELQGRTLSFRFHLPAALLRQLDGPISLHAVINGVALPSRTYAIASEHVYQCKLPTNLGANCHIEFILDRALPPSATDPRELGILVCFPTESDRDYRPMIVT